MPDEKDKDRPGPEPERLKIEGDWNDAVRKAIGKKRPPEGWPKGDEADENEERPARP